MDGCGVCDGDGGSCKTKVFFNTKGVTSKENCTEELETVLKAALEVEVGLKQKPLLKMHFRIMVG